MLDQIASLDMMDLDWFYDFLDKFNKNQAKIKRTINNNIQYFTLVNKGKPPIDIWSSDVSYYRNEFIFDNHTFLKKNLQLNNDEVDILIVLYGILLFEHNTIIAMGSYFKVPSINEISKLSEHHKLIINQFLNGDKMHGIENVFESLKNILIEYSMPIDTSIIPKKSVRLNKINERYTKNNLTKPKVFRKFSEIMYNMIVLPSDYYLEKNSPILPSKVESVEKPIERHSPEYLLTVSEAAEYMRRSTSFVYTLTSGKKIDFSRPNGKNIYIKRSVLDEYMLKNPSKSESEDDNSKANTIIFGK